MRSRDLGARAIKHALHGELARAWGAWTARESIPPLGLARRAASYFMAHSTVGAFHTWVTRKREADAALERTFASAAAILPNAGGIAPTGGVPLSPSPGTPPQKKATPARPASRRATADWRATTRAPTGHQAAARARVTHGSARAHNIGSTPPCICATAIALMRARVCAAVCGGITHTAW